MTLEPLEPVGVRFEELPEQAWPRHEIIDGSLLVTPMAGVPHQIVVSRLTRVLGDVAPAEWEVLAGVNVMRRRQSDRLLIPDVAVVDAAVAVAESGVAIRPEDVYLAVEVISPSSAASDLYLKKQLYAEWGIGTYWVLDPATHEVHEFGLRDSASTWLAEADLDGIWPTS